MRRVLVARAGCLPAALLTYACAGPQSALDPGGRGAERVADLFWLLTAGALAIWFVAVALWVWAVYFARKPQSERGRKLLIVGGGVVFPVVTLALVLGYSLRMLPALVERAPEGSLVVEVVGHQWWWRVHYPSEDGSEPIALANEIRLPAGEPVQLELETRDVIHSIWIPALGGKMDMIPGRRTTLLLEPLSPGVYRGACAEYCGASHALMAFAVVVEQPEEFQEWLSAQAEPAAPPPLGSLGERGQDVFLANGCGACHAIRGTPADGTVGPDLTHVGSRLSLAAGTLPNETAAFRRFVAATGDVKPDVHMPAFGMLTDEELTALGAYLDGLQ